MKIHFAKLVWLFNILLISACNQIPGVQIVIPVPTPTVLETGAPESTLYRADAARSGVYQMPALPDLHGVKWQKSFAEDAYFPMYADGTLYIGTANGSLLALDPQSGEERWSYDVGDGPILAVAVANGFIYFGAGSSGFYALSIGDGTLAWSFETDGSVWSSSPLVADDHAYFGSDTGRVYALDLTTQKTAWTFRAASGVLWQVAGDAEQIYVPTQNYLYALDRDTGAEIWRASTSDKWNAPAVANRVVFAGNGDRQFIAFDAETGKERWSFMAPFTQWSEWSAPVITANTVYVGYSNNTMYAFDAKTGEEQWQFQTEDWATTDPILAEDVLYFGVGAHANLAQPTEDRDFYALNAKTGEPIWTFKADGLVYAAATLGEDVVYFKTLNNILYALH